MRNFTFLVDAIQDTHLTMQQNAAKAINTYLTIRNWLIGFYIVEFEQNGEDRAQYGGRLLDTLGETLKINGLGARNLKLFRQFYLAYPKIVQTPSAQFSQALETGSGTKSLANTFKSNALQIDPNHSDLVRRLSFSHFSLLLPIKEPAKRAFYETECSKGNWSVGELKRQINTLYYERSGISIKPEKLAAEINARSEEPRISDIIKSPFTFEFLGLKSKDVVYENDLEKALVDNLEAFLIELGHGFCFEAKQKRLTIGGEYFFVDLVFYHRILKCHILVELKTQEARHEHIGQLKTYINYFKKEIMIAGDNPPVGLLLVTDQNKAMVEYAVADSDAALFVSKYLVELPTKEQLAQFIRDELHQL